jgi:hypothetical protein
LAAFWAESATDAAESASLVVSNALTAASGDTLSAPGKVGVVPAMLLVGKSPGIDDCSDGCCIGCNDKSAGACAAIFESSEGWRRPSLDLIESVAAVSALILTEASGGGSDDEIERELPDSALEKSEPISMSVPESAVVALTTKFRR